MEIERNANAYHACSFCRVSRSCLPSGSTNIAMSEFEKHVAKMDDADLATLLSSAVPSMDAQARGALIASIFDAFRDRGESSEDAAEGAGTHLPMLESSDPEATRLLVAYSNENHGVLKEALVIFETEHAEHLNALPRVLRAGS